MPLGGRLALLAEAAGEASPGSRPSDTPRDFVAFVSSFVIFVFRRSAYAIRRGARFNAYARDHLVHKPTKRTKDGTKITKFAA